LRRPSNPILNPYIKNGEYRSQEESTRNPTHNIYVPTFLENEMIGQQLVTSLDIEEPTIDNR
jgi:hypothetical protein